MKRLKNLIYRFIAYSILVLTGQSLFTIKMANEWMETQIKAGKVINQFGNLDSMALIFNLTK